MRRAAAVEGDHLYRRSSHKVTMLDHLYPSDHLAALSADDRPLQITAMT